MGDKPPAEPRRGSTVEMVDRIRDETARIRAPKQRELVGYNEDGKPIYVDTTHF